MNLNDTQEECGGSVSVALIVVKVLSGHGKQRPMLNPILEAPTGTTMALRALARFPDRTVHIRTFAALAKRDEA